MAPEENRQRQFILLKEILIDWFDQDELEDISFDLGLDFNALGGTTKEGNIRNLLMLLSRRGRLAKLIHLCDLHRPEINWDLFSLLLEPAPVDPVLVSQISHSEVSENRPQRLGLILGLVAIFLFVVVSGFFATTYYLNRTARLAPTPLPVIINIPATETPSAAEIVVIQPTSTLNSPASTNPKIEPSLETGIDNESNEEVDGLDLIGVAATQTVEAPRDNEVGQADGNPITLTVADTYAGERLQVANVRSGPGVEYEVVTQVVANSAVEAIAVADNSNGLAWYLIKIGDTEIGWISSVLIKDNPTAVQNIPPAATVPASPIIEPTPTEEPFDQQDNAQGGELNQTN